MTLIMAVNSQLTQLPPLRPPPTLLLLSLMIITKTFASIQQPVTRKPAICPNQNVTSTKLILARNNVQLKCGARSKKLPGRWRHRWKDHPKTAFQEICSKEVNQIKHTLNIVQWWDPK